MQTVKASEFKAKCLHLMDLVNESGEEIIITKNGKPVSRQVLYRKSPASFDDALKAECERYHIWYLFVGATVVESVN